jgi:hypothetical protein
MAWGGHPAPPRAAATAAPTSKPVAPPEKVIVLTPVIAQVEKLLVEVESLENETHPDLVRMKKEQAETLQQQFAHLDNYLEHLKQLLEKQTKCEIQSIEDEMEEFTELNSP